MTSLSVADRRAIFTWARFDPEFRERLEAEPKRMVEAVIKRPLPDDTKIELIDESAAWSFVLTPPDRIDAELPEPFDVRSAVENDVYAALRDDPAALGEAKADPVGFLRDRFEISVHDVNLLDEAAGTMRIVLPGLGREDDELHDAALDRVSGGGFPGEICPNCKQDHSKGGAGDPGSQCGKIGNPYNSNPAPR